MVSFFNGKLKCIFISILFYFLKILHPFNSFVVRRFTALLVSNHNLSRINQYHLVEIWLRTICHTIVIRFNLISQ